jgi:heme/copper-type cytochrome/quinol oxidase subunit 2
MRFRDQIGWMALFGWAAFGLGMVVWMGSQAAGVKSDSWFITMAWALVVGGIYLLVLTLFRTVAKRGQLRAQHSSAVHPTATLGPINRWYFWVDRNGKDRDA